MALQDPVSRKRLAEAAWMAELTAFERSRVEHEASDVRIPKGGYVFHSGERYPFWVGVAEGTLKSTKSSAEGKQVNFVYILEGTWFGEGTLINDDVRRYTVQAVEDTLLLRLPVETFDWLIDSSTRFNRFILRQMSATMSQFIAMVEYQRTLDISARVARMLASVFTYNVAAGKRENVAFDLTIPQEDLAAMCGVSRQTFNTVMKELQQAGIVELAYRSLRILDIDRLRSFGETE